MQLVEGHLRATGVNVSGYSLFRPGIELHFDPEAPIGSARIRCAQRAHGDAEVAQTAGLRASYPRSVEEGRLNEQELPESGVQVEFGSHGRLRGRSPARRPPSPGGERDGDQPRMAHLPHGVERWHWFLPPGVPKVGLTLPFVDRLADDQIPAVDISCTVETSAGTATVHTAGAFAHISEPIAE